MRSGELSPRAAAEMVRAAEKGDAEEEEDRPQPERHTPLQQKEIENQAQRTRLQGMQTDLDEANETIVYLNEQQSPDDAVREQTFNNLRAEVRTLKSQVSELPDKTHGRGAPRQIPRGQASRGEKKGERIMESLVKWLSM